MITTHLAEVVTPARRPPAGPRGRQAAHRARPAHATRSSSRSSPRPSSASARCSGCCRRCSTRASRCATWSASSRRCRCGPRRPRTSTPSSRRPAPRSARRSSRPHVVDGAVHVISFDPQLEQRMLEALRPTDERARGRPRPGHRPGACSPSSPHLLADAENRNLRPVARLRPAAARRRTPDGAPGRRPAARAVLPRARRRRQVRSVGTVTGRPLAVTA